MDLEGLSEEFESGSVTTVALDLLLPDFLARIDRAALRRQCRATDSLPGAIRAQIQEQFASELVLATDEELEVMDADTACHAEMRREAISSLFESAWRYIDDELIEPFDSSYAMSCSGPEGSMTAYHVSWTTVEWDGGGALVYKEDSDYLDGDQYTLVGRWAAPHTAAECIADHVVSSWGEWLREGSDDQPSVRLHGRDLTEALDRIVGTTVEDYCSVVRRVVRRRYMVPRGGIEVRAAAASGADLGVVRMLLDHVLEHGTPPSVVPDDALDILRAVFWAAWDESWAG